MVRIYFCIYRYWSLTEATSNINKNYIVTGIRFVKKSRVIHLEVEQARALPEGIKMYRLYLKLIFCVFLLFFDNLDIMVHSNTFQDLLMKLQEFGLNRKRSK